MVRSAFFTNVIQAARGGEAQIAPQPPCSRAGPMLRQSFHFSWAPERKQWALTPQLKPYSALAVAAVSPVWQDIARLLVQAW